MFHVLKALLKGRKFNAKYYTNNILVNLRLEAADRGTWPNKLLAHSDNVRPHITKMSRDYIVLNQMKQAPHPHIRQIWHPRTFLFGYVKEKLMGYRAETPSELLVRIWVILAEILQENLKAIFLEWMERLQKCMHVDGEYVG
jgi:hypothetical protein